MRESVFRACIWSVNDAVADISTAFTAGIIVIHKYQKTTDRYYDKVLADVVEITANTTKEELDE